MKHRINLIVGRTGSGKSTVAHNLCTIFPDKYSQVKSYTTRPRRTKETDHLFISADRVKEFESQIAAYTKIGNYEYFTTLDVLNKNNLYVIDPKGIVDLKKRCGDCFEFCVIYLDVPEELRITRLRQRGDTAQVIAERLAAEHDEFSAFEASGGYDISLDCKDYSKSQMPYVVHTCIENFWKYVDEVDYE